MDIARPIYAVGRLRLAAAPVGLSLALGQDAHLLCNGRRWPEMLKAPSDAEGGHHVGEWQDLLHKAEATEEWALEECVQQPGFYRGIRDVGELAQERYQLACVVARSERCSQQAVPKRQVQSALCQV